MQRQAFGLAFDVRKASTTKSGFEPAPYDLGAGVELFGPLRLRGWAAMMRLNFVDTITIVGGDEGRYAGETPVVNRASAIREMLIHDCGIEASRVDAVASKSNTRGNIGIIADRTTSRDDIVVTNHYHIPRTFEMLWEARVPLLARAAEAFIILAEFSRKEALKEEIIAELGGNPIAIRLGDEIQGIAQIINKTYVSRTDAAPVSFGSKAPA